jgi:hypothetical protein
MFQRQELACLEARKSLLVLESDINRQTLAADWRHLRRPETWVDEVGQAAKRHPIWTAVLSALAGAVAVQSVRKSTAVASGIDRLGKIATVAFSVWKMFKRARGSGEEG